MMIYSFIYLFHLFIIMSAKCAKASLHHDTDSDNNAAHNCDSSLSLSNAEPHYLSYDLSANNL